jgi:flavin-dependent dehydrogenase
MLARAAESVGVTLILDSRVHDIERARNEWRLTVSTGSPVSARFIVDATGGAAAVARRFGARFVEADRLIGIARFFESGSNDPRTLVESFEDGWWYTAGLPDGRRIIACMTDADLARCMRLRETEEWSRRLDAMPNVGAMARRINPCSPLMVRSAASRRLEPAAGANWLAVGDSASRFDPLSSQGIVKALRSGIFGSYALSDLLTRDDDSGLDRYRRYVMEEFKSYAEIRTKYYREEQRWPQSEFWRRRHVTVDETPTDFESLSIPKTVLVRNGASPGQPSH